MNTRPEILATLARLRQHRDAATDPLYRESFRLAATLLRHVLDVMDLADALDRDAAARLQSLVLDPPESFWMGEIAKTADPGKGDDDDDTEDDTTPLAEPAELGEPVGAGGRLFEGSDRP